MKKILSFIISVGLGAATLAAQPLPPPPAGNMPPPPGVTILPPPAQPVAPTNQMMPQYGQPAMAPPPPNTPPGWGAPGMLVNPPSSDWMNSGTMNVMATGYDTESVLVQIPLVVSYSFNGVNYNITVLNSWSPLTQTWNLGVDVPANQTSYYFNGFNYNYVAYLPSGTFYFNL